MRILEFESSMIETKDGISDAVDTVVQSAPGSFLVVVEAMGRTEERLLEAGEKSAAQDLVLASTLAEGARTRHMQIARQLVSERVWTEAQNLLAELFEELSDLLQGLYLIGELSEQGKIVLKSYAERASALIFAEALKEQGIRAQAVCGRQPYLLESSHTSKNFLENTRNEFQEELTSLSKSETVPVIPKSLCALA